MCGLSLMIRVREWDGGVDRSGRFGVLGGRDGGREGPLSGVVGRITWIVSV